MNRLQHNNLSIHVYINSRLTCSAPLVWSETKTKMVEMNKSISVVKPRKLPVIHLLCITRFRCACTNSPEARLSSTNDKIWGQDPTTVSLVNRFYLRHVSINNLYKRKLRMEKKESTTRMRIDTTFSGIYVNDKICNRKLKDNDRELRCVAVFN